MSSNDDRVNHSLRDRPPASWQQFVYFSQAIEDRALPSQLASGEGDLHAESVLPLLVMQVGDRVHIVSLNCGDSNNRLMAMGLMPGTALEVISCTTTGSVIVALQDQRVGLGAEMARQILVIPMVQPSKPHSAPPTLEKRGLMLTHSPGSEIPLKLRDVAIGSMVRVIGYEPTSRDYKRKLLAMGLTPGTELMAKRHAPLGDPTEIEVRGFRLSLRKDEADALIVEAV